MPDKFHLIFYAHSLRQLCGAAACLFLSSGSNPLFAQDLLLSNSPAASGVWIMDSSNPSPSTDLNSSIQNGISLAGNYFLFMPGTADNSGVLAALPSGFGQYGWRSQSPLSGTYAAGSWSLNVKLENRSIDIHSGRVWARIWKSADPSGSGATALSSWAQGASVLAFPAALATLTDNIPLASLPATDLNNEYLFLECAWGVSLASLSPLAGVSFVCDEGLAESLVAPAFLAYTPTPAPTVPAPGSPGRWDAPAPGALLLESNSFNPDRQALRLGFNMPREGNALVEVYSLSGSRLRTLCSGTRAPGTMVLNWDGKDEQGLSLGSDLVYVRADLAGTVSLRKVLLFTGR